MLDAELPGLDAYRDLRRAGGPPLIMLTPDGAGRDDGFDADDYLPKPVSVPDLVHRLRAVDRRSRSEGDPVLVRGPLTVDTRRREVRVHRIPVPLSPKEFDLLALLAAEPGAVVTRRYLMERVWGPGAPGPGKTLDFHVASLRRKLGDSAWIENRRGVGFRLAIPA
ncbi:DNA-binding response regulator [Actinoplanes sp. NBRC 14428]|nr:DNA-binding response regulator [Actinoplanes sp. NBRC 14428]